MDENVKRWARFALGGGLNTLFSYVVYLLLNQFLMYQIAYFFAYCVGILFSYWFNSSVVFRLPLSRNAFFAFPTVYFLQYAASAFFLGITINVFGFSEKFSPLIVTAIMVPVTYVMTKFILHRFSSNPNKKC